MASRDRRKPDGPVAREGSTAAGVAFSHDEAMPRDAGREATRDGPDDDWTLEDEASDESFPASDPPAYSA